jgi:hypothetical protein
MKPRFEASADVEKLCDYLRSKSRATYREMSQLLGRDIQQRERYILESARRRLERSNIMFVVETGVGLVRASDAQVASLATDIPINKIRRAAHRARKREKIVNVQQLSEHDRAAFYIGRAVLGAITQASGRAFRNQVVKATAAGDGPIPLVDTMKLFAKVRQRRSESMQ